MEDRQFVESHWERVQVCDGSYRHYVEGIILLNWSNHCFHEFDSWQAAAEFTRQRLEEIRQLEREMHFMQCHHVGHIGYLIESAEEEGWPDSLLVDTVREHCADSRIYDRLQRELASLKRGMKLGT